MINCYIIGDQTTIDCLKEHIEKFPLTVLKGYSFTTVSNLEGVLTDTPTILFVEVELITKFKAALTKIGKLCTIIYVADTKNYAYEAFETLALDYLMQPVTYDVFERSMNKFINFSLLAPAKTSPVIQINHKIDSITDSFFIKSDFRGQKEILIKCNDVLFIEAEQNYVVLRTIDKKFICHNTLKEMEENLPDRYFIRVHKSFIINYDKITSVEGNVIVLNENEKYKIQIGNTYKKAFFERKSQKIIRKKNNFDMVGYSKYATLILFLIETFVDNFSFI